jgi:hypothetical protein
LMKLLSEAEWMEARWPPELLQSFSASSPANQSSTTT